MSSFSSSLLVFLATTASTFFLFLRWLEHHGCRALIYRAIFLYEFLGYFHKHFVHVLTSLGTDFHQDVGTDLLPSGLRVLATHINSVNIVSFVSNEGHHHL